MCEKADLRYGKLVVSADLMLFLGQGTYKVEANPIPDDATVVSASYQPDYRRFDIVFRSSELPILQLGESIPVVSSPIIRRIDKLPLTPPPPREEKRLCLRPGLELVMPIDAPLLSKETVEALQKAVEI